MATRTIVNVVAPTYQEFMGRRYYKCGDHFRATIPLHRAVYEAVFGPIPKGMDVHHKDENPANNEPGNLELLPRGRHISRHRKGSTHTRPVPAAARRAAAEWHRSEEGRRWHREQYEKTGFGAIHQRKEFACEQCGRSYETTATGRNRFCSPRCSMRWHRAAGTFDEKRHCLVCGLEFVAYRYAPTRTCSRKCGRALQLGRTR